MKRPAQRGKLWTCPQCGNRFRAQTYDIGSGPEVSCPGCEWCWGAEGQDLQPLPRPTGGLVLYFDGLTIPGDPHVEGCNRAHHPDAVCNPEDGDANR